MTRKTDQQGNSVHFQMDRFAQQNGEWFYSTREYAEKGPFISRDDAEGDLSSFVDNNYSHSQGMKRATDTQGEVVHFQMGRFAQQNGEWYYSTREHVERGPFISKNDAENDLVSYIHHRNNVEKYSH